MAEGTNNMRHVYDNDYLAETPPSCVAVGHFEGVHKGHLALAERLSSEAKARGLTSILVSLYDPDAATLSTEAEKAARFASCGVDVLYSLEETWMVRAMQPSTFEGLILKRRLNAQAGVTGAEVLSEYPSLETVVCPAVQEGGQAVMTQRLCAALDAGDLDAYAALAGGPYLMQGVIGHGRHLGQTVGMPTANLELPRNKRKPPNGVYATVSTIGGEAYMGLTNVGPRPTVDDSEEVTVETTLLGLDRELYGEPQQIEFYIRIRDVQKFAGLPEVKAQVDRDFEQVRGRLSEIVSQRKTVAS